LRKIIPISDSCSNDSWTVSIGGACHTSGVTVAIVFYDGLDDLIHCLACLASQTLAPTRVLVIDNSTEGLPDSLPACGCLSEVVRPERNVGFAAGNNLALHQTKTEFFATLNADAFPEPDWLAAMVEAAQRHPEAAAFGSLQLLFGDPSIADGVGDHYHMSGLAWRSGHLCPIAALDLSARRIFSPCGAAAFFRRADLESIGGFDEDFFCYCEDIDLGFRLRLMGRECRFVPSAVVHHRGAGSTGDSHSEFAVYHGHRNLSWVYLKNMPGFLFWIFLPFHILLSIQMVHAVALRGQGPVIRKAKWDVLLSLGDVWGKRLAIQARRKASCFHIWHALDKGVPPEPWRRSLSRLRAALANRLRNAHA
jgi:GT2 family glycosyltransferase